MAKITVEADDSLLADYPRRWPARVRVIAAATPHERLVTDVPGDPARAFNRAEMQKKFLRFVGPARGMKMAERIMTRCSEVLESGRFALLVTDIG
jgi:2-methylcitrate dehydratase PrpD